MSVVGKPRPEQGQIGEEELIRSVIIPGWAAQIGRVTGRQDKWLLIRAHGLQNSAYYPTFQAS